MTGTNESVSPSRHMKESMREVIARSSFGGDAWCRECHHPDLSHRKTGRSERNRGRCEYPECACKGLVRMTPEEWIASEIGR